MTRKLIIILFSNCFVLEQLPSKFVELPPFDYTLYEENCGVEWKNWHRSFEWYLKANHVENDDDKYVKLLHLAGRKVQEVFETLPTPPSVSKIARGPLATGFVPHLSQYELAVVKLNEFFEPKKNLTYERHMFRSISQEKGEKIGIFTMRLRTQAEKCDFGTSLEDNIKDQIIEKCSSAKLRRDLLKLGDAKLDDVLKTAKIFEAINDQSKTFDLNEPKSTFSPSEVNKIESKSSMRQNLAIKSVDCTRCGYTGHRSFDDKCPAKGKICNKCGGRDHFSRKCRSKKSLRMTKPPQPNPTKTSSQTDIKQEEDDQQPVAKKTKSDETVKLVEAYQSNIKDEYIFCISDEYIFGISDQVENETMRNEIMCKIGGVQLKVVIDSGTKRNIVDSEAWEFLKANHVIVISQRKGDDQTFKAYGGHPLTVVGVFKALIETAHNCRVAEFFVLKDYGKVLIGYDTGVPLGVMKIGEFVNQIEGSSELSKIKGIIIDIPIRDDVKPVAQPYRRVPVPLEKAVDKKIDELLAQGIIEKVKKK